MQPFFSRDFQRKVARKEVYAFNRESSLARSLSYSDKYVLSWIPPHSPLSEGPFSETVRFLLFLKTAIMNEEQEQLKQTIEMFEVIVEASPHDCQSMEILKDAYNRLGREPQAVAMARRLADTYLELGQYSLAMLEYEGILQREPNNVEVIAALGEVEERLQKSNAPGRYSSAASEADASAETSDIKVDFTAAGSRGSLMATDRTRKDAELDLDSERGREKLEREDGNDSLAKFLILHRIVPDDVVQTSLDLVTQRNRERPPSTLGESLLTEIVKCGDIEIDNLLCAIIEHSKFAYIPLQYYDIDRSVVKMLPEDLTLGRLIIPFDIMSRTLMIAMANPFDAAGKEAIQQLLDYNIQWHLASPEAISKVLKETYRLTPGAPTLATSAYSPQAQVQEAPTGPLPDTSGFRLNH